MANNGDSIFFFFVGGGGGNCSMFKYTIVLEDRFYAKFFKVYLV